MYIAYPTLKYDDTIFASYPDGDRSWYHEAIVGNDTLIVTIGDSWTWGDSLCDIDARVGISDTPLRTLRVYGNLLSKKMNADFVNIAMCGTDNLWMLEKAREFLTQLSLNYTNVYVIFTLTENCRELKSSTIWADSTNSSTTLSAFLEQYETNMYLDIQKLVDDFPTTKFVIGRNFTHTYGCNRNLLSCLQLKKNWIACLSEQQTIQDYPKHLRLLTMMSYDPLETYFSKGSSYDMYKKDVVSFVDSSLEATKWLDQSKYNYKKHTKHPTEYGHHIWAEYLYSNLVQV